MLKLVRSIRCRSARFALLAIAAGGFIHAQAVSAVRSGSFEIDPFIGASYGVDFRVMGGANVSFAVNKWLLPYGEFSYFPGIGRTETGMFAGTGNPVTLHYNVPMSDFHGGVHIRLPIHESPIVPYLAFGAGGLHSYATTVSATYQVAGGATQMLPGLPAAASNNFALNFGGGIRFYLSQRFGMRVEAKAYKPFGDLPGLFGNTPPNVFGKVEFGVFYQAR